MTFSWTPHRFAGGALALDVANSVVLRFDPARRIDRYADPAGLTDFAAAATRFSAEKILFGPLEPVAPENRAAFLHLRETTDRHFRAEVLGNPCSQWLADLLDAASSLIRRHPLNTVPTALDAATARSALTLVTSGEPARLKICPNCQWLFLDRSRNLSRTWCDMTVCGNRVKASRHYHRQKKELSA
ncbi:MAG TPA: CGNR zinc finger domain-containing protein [Pararhizobium sp.]|uniref:CGNR zinc finger domain-containing protein n=1 Tax=Pararhizobium sp. TaxID=1977563 RepID=UPI002CC0EB53|nr:CGNR zinc finger domain-containing protein [Pararhizobium sp.]HTO30228.1 CGNR zinc finger domain-containing protein [Pararhizobium sp.]